MRSGSSSVSELNNGKDVRDMRIALKSADAKQDNSGGLKVSSGRGIDEAIATARSYYLNENNPLDKRYDYMCKWITLSMARSENGYDKGGKIRADRDITYDNIMEIINTGDLDKGDYFKGRARLLLAQYYLNQVNDGKLDTNDAVPQELLKLGLTDTQPAILIQYSIDLCDAGKKIIKNPVATSMKQAQTTSTNVKGATDNRKKKKDSTPVKSTGTITQKGLDYYALNFSDVLQLRLRAVKRGANDTDANLRNGYETVITKINGNIPQVKQDNAKLQADGTITDDDRDKEIGLKRLIEIVNIDIASSYLSEQDTDKLQAGTDKIDKAIASLETLQNSAEYKALATYYTEQAVLPPRDSFEYIAAKSLKGELVTKKNLLIDPTMIPADVDTINMTCAQKKFDFGLYPLAMSVQANLDIINKANAIDKLKDITLYVPNASGGFTANTFKTKDKAINGVIDYLQNARGLIAPNRYLSLQTKMLEANFRMMAAKSGKDPKVKALLDDVIAALGNINDPIAKADIKARVNSVYARANAMDTEDLTDPEIKIIVLKESLRKLNASKAAADDYKAKCLERDKTAKDMDESFYAELYQTYGDIKSQLAWAYNSIILLLKSTKTSNPSYEAALKALKEGGACDELSEKNAAGKIVALTSTSVYKDYDEAITKHCNAARNKSFYDKNVRAQLIELSKQNFDSSMVDVNAQDAAKLANNMKALNDIYGKLTIEAKGDDDQRKYESALLAKAKINVMASRIFLKGNNDGSEEDMGKDYAEIIKLKATAEDGLYQSEIYYLDQTILGASMAMLRFSKYRSDALSQIGGIYQLLKDEKELTYDMASAFTVYATSGITDERTVAEKIKASLEKIKSRSESIKNAIIKKRTLAKVLSAIADVQSWVLAKRSDNKSDMDILRSARDNYALAIDTYGDKSLSTLVKYEQCKLIILLDTDLRKDVFNDAGRKKIAKERTEGKGKQESLKDHIANLNKIIGTEKSPNDLDRGVKGSRDLAAKISAYQWLGVINFAMADMIEQGLITSTKSALAYTKDAKDIFEKAIGIYNSLSLSSAEKAAIGITAASVYRGKIDALSTVALNEKDPDKKSALIDEVKEVIKVAIKQARTEDDKISEGMLKILEANMSYWVEKNPADALPIYQAGFKLMTGKKNIDDLGEKDYLGVSIRDLFNYADATAIASYRQDTSLRPATDKLLKTVIRLDGNRSAYSAAANTRLGDFVNVIIDYDDTNRDQAAKDHKPGINFLCKALDLLNGATIGSNVATQINFINIVKDANPDKTRRIMEAMCILFESEVRTYNCEIRGEKDKQARWKKEFALATAARDILKNYLEISLNLKVGDIKDIGDVVETVYKDNSDLGRRLRKVVKWRAKLVASGCDNEIGIMAPEAIKAYENDYRQQDFDLSDE